MAFTDRGSGEPVILLHGIPTWSFLYAEVIGLLEPHCRVLAPDFLGHGWSDRRDRFDRSLVAQTAAILARPPSSRSSIPTAWLGSCSLMSSPTTPGLSRT